MSIHVTCTNTYYHWCFVRGKSLCIIMATNIKFRHLLHSPPPMEVLCARRIRRMISDVGDTIQGSSIEKLTTLRDFVYLDNHCKLAALRDMSKYCY